MDPIAEIIVNVHFSGEATAIRIKQEQSKEDEIMRRSLAEEEFGDCFDKLIYMSLSNQDWQEPKRKGTYC